MFKTIEYNDDKLIIIDQTQLPLNEVYLTLETKEDVWQAIKDLQVRGAPAIGVAAAYGIYIAYRKDMEKRSSDKLKDKKLFADLKNYLASSRPTAVNLFWALDRMEKRFNMAEDAHVMDELLDEAKRIHLEDEESNRLMGEYGLSLLKPGMGILTHCNAGALATSKYGTALSPLYLGQERGYNFKVFADETRPLLQGARLTAWELMKEGIDVTLICDNMASHVMKQGLVDAVLVGCDRLALNGDAANKIGTSGLSIIAKEYGVPFYVFAPTSTIDENTATGDDINIEIRHDSEIHSMWYSQPMAPEGVKVYNPAFDITPHENIRAVITEKGIREY